MNTHLTANSLVAMLFTISVAGVANQNQYADRLYLISMHQFLPDIEFDNQQECLRFLCSPKPKRHRPTFAISSSYSRPHWPNSDKSVYESLANETLKELMGALNGQFSVVTDDHNNPIGVSTLEGQDENVLGPSETLLPAQPNNVDTSVCCSTVEHYFINFTMTDISGISRTLAQFEHTGSFQIVRHGVCGSQGVCPGTCSQVYVTTQLAIFPNDPGQVVTYRYFNIPGYCTCKILLSKMSTL